MISGRRAPVFPTYAQCTPHTEPHPLQQPETRVDRYSGSQRDPDPGHPSITHHATSAPDPAVQAMMASVKKRKLTFCVLIYSLWKLAVCTVVLYSVRQNSQGGGNLESTLNNSAWLYVNYYQVLTHPISRVALLAAGCAACTSSHSHRSSPSQ